MVFIPSKDCKEDFFVSDLNNPIIFDGKPMVYSLIVPKKEEEEASCSK
jgi:hypothetical protein